LIKSASLIHFLLRIEKYILKKSDIVSSISAGMIKKIVAKYAREVVFFPNWVDTNLFFPIKEKKGLKEEFGFKPNDQVILYSGAIGEKQGLDAIITSAEAMQASEDLKFVICGSGPYKEKLQEITKSRKLENIFFLPLQPFEKLNHFLNMADVHLVIQKANAADLVMPSKLSAILSVGGLAILTANTGSSLFDVVDGHKMGVLIESENQVALTHAIKRLSQNNMGDIQQNARLYAQEYLAIESIFKKFTTHLQ